MMSYEMSISEDLPCNDELKPKVLFIQELMKRLKNIIHAKSYVLANTSLNRQKRYFKLVICRLPQDMSDLVKHLCDFKQSVRESPMPWFYENTYKSLVKAHEWIQTKVEIALDQYDDLMGDPNKSAFKSNSEYLKHYSTTSTVKSKPVSNNIKNPTKPMNYSGFKDKETYYWLPRQDSGSETSCEYPFPSSLSTGTETSESTDTSYESSGSSSSSLSGSSASTQTESAESSASEHYDSENRYSDGSTNEQEDCYENYLAENYGSGYEEK